MIYVNRSKWEKLEVLVARLKEQAMEVDSGSRT